MSLPRPRPLCEPGLRGALQDVGVETWMLPAQPALAEAWFLQLKLPNPGPRLLGGKSKSHTLVTAAATTQAPVTSSLGVSEQKPEFFWAKPQHEAHFFSLPMMLCEWAPGLFLMGCVNVARRGLTPMLCLHILIFSQVARRASSSRDPLVKNERCSRHLIYHSLMVHIQ